MSRIFFDTNIFIYLFEERGALGKRVVSLRQRMLERGDRLFTSAMTLAEILVKPIQLGNRALAAEYEAALPAAATILPFSAAEAPHFARLRAGREVGPADAVQLACAAAAGIDLFITNDERLSRIVTPGIQFIVPLDRAFL